jgi:rfaE bifunctional protein kinase chain/domain/rfaE bifunctional protein nucleotidyltransferase chain/domain
MNKIISLEDLNKKIYYLKKNKKKIVLCHGVFDVIHAGHISHFKSAKKFGDILIISVTTDKFVNKGFNRPIFNLINRKKILSELSVVDFVCESDSQDAMFIIDKIKPNIYCKGPDYKNFNNDITDKIKKEIKILKKFGGKFKVTDDETFSSSKIINTMNKGTTLNEKFLLKINKKFTKDEINKAVKSFDDLKVLVIGESILDEYTYCETLGKSGKEPVLTMKPIITEKYLGGSLAICNHLSSFCKKISLVSYLGENGSEDSFIRKNLKKNIKAHFIKKKNSPTILKKRFIENIDNIKTLGLYSLNDSQLDKKNESDLYKIIKKQIPFHDLIIVCDYGHGLISKKITNLIIKSGKFYTYNSQINSSNFSYHTLDKFINMKAVVINANELKHEFRDNHSSVVSLGKKLQKKLKTNRVIVTQGKDGVTLINKNKVFHAPAFTKNVVDKIGAGDAMLALASLCFKKNLDDLLILYLGSIAAGHVVETMSNSSPIDRDKILKIISHQILN